jgi:hypothetical protein
MAMRIHQTCRKRRAANSKFKTAPVTLLKNAKTPFA